MAARFASTEAACSSAEARTESTTCRQYTKSVLRFAILGAGFMGATYAECLAHHVPDAELVAVAGGRRAPELAQRYGVEAEADVKAAISRDDVDAVIIASPHSTHVEQAVTAAGRGKHVYAEKPLARTVADCDAIIAACERGSVALAVNSVTRFRDSPR